MKLTPTIVPTESDKAYAAGFLDGEGCVSLYRRERTEHGRHGDYWTAQVGIAQVDPTPLLWLAERWGGYFRASGVRRQSTHRQAYELQWHGRNAGVLLADLLPYLQVKKVQAEALLRFIELLRKPGRPKLGTGVNHSERDRLRLVIHEANHKEVVA
jgi:hypothetical protein